MELSSTGWQNYFVNTKYEVLQASGLTDTAIIQQYQNDLVELQNKQVEWQTSAEYKNYLCKITGLLSAIKILEDRLDEELSK